MYINISFTYITCVRMCVCVYIYCTWIDVLPKRLSSRIFSQKSFSLLFQPVNEFFVHVYIIFWFNCCVCLFVCLFMYVRVVNSIFNQSYISLSSSFSFWVLKIIRFFFIFLFLEIFYLIVNCTRIAVLHGTLNPIWNSPRGGKLFSMHLTW